MPLEVINPSLPLNGPTGVSKSTQSRYQYLLYINGVLFSDLSGVVQNRAFTQTRNRPDDISFTLDLDKFSDLATQLNTNPQDLLQVGVSEIRVKRNGVTITAGQIMNWDANLGNDRKIDVKAKGWLELFKYRLSNNTYTSHSAAYIAQNEVVTTQARPFGSFGISLGVAPSPDTTNVYASKVYDNKPIYDLLVELSEESGGFDLEVTWDKILNIYTKIGSVRPEILLSYPGNLKDIHISNDSSRLVNAITGRGAGYGVEQITASVADTDSQQVYAIREATQDHADVSDTTQLTNLITGELTAYKAPIVLHDVTVDAGHPSAPQIGSFRVGDQVQINVQKLKLYGDINKYFTIDAITVTIGDEDQEEVKLSLN